MSQNGPYPGPPWSSGSGGRSEEPYTEPADPWGDAAADAPSWSAGLPPAIPHQPDPASYSQAGQLGPHTPPPTWGRPPPMPRRNTSMVALVVALGLLICVGLGTTAWLLKERNDKKNAAARQAQTTVSATDLAVPAPESSENARFVTEGQCVFNEGSREKPAMRQSVCTTGTFQVLKRINGKTSGEKDAVAKCAKVTGYTQWYFYDSDLDDLDFVLCLKERKPV
jgi:hypothetical protein